MVKRDQSRKVAQYEVKTKPRVYTKEMKPVFDLMTFLSLTMPMLTGCLVQVSQGKNNIHLRVTSDCFSRLSKFKLSMAN